MIFFKLLYSKLSANNDGYLIFYDINLTFTLKDKFKVSMYIFNEARFICTTKVIQLLSFKECILINFMPRET